MSQFILFIVFSLVTGISLLLSIYSYIYIVREFGSLSLIISKTALFISPFLSESVDENIENYELYFILNVLAIFLSMIIIDIFKIIKWKKSLHYKT